MMRFVAILLIANFTLFLLSSAHAQSRLRPLQQESSISLKNSSRLKVSHLDTIALPFWDDFSNGSLANGLWFDGKDVSINLSKAINLPSLYAATFDGVDSLGIPYNASSNKVGLTDELISQAINLNGASSVYISFWWQSGGNVDPPEANDSIRLQFLSPSGKWHTAWSDSGERNYDSFKVENIQITDSLNFEGFQFRFQSFGNQSGMLDSWHIDYIYLNDNRSALDLNFPDVAISSAPSRLFDTYSAIPLDHFLEDTLEFLTNSEIIISNINDQLTNFDYSAQVRDKNNFTIIDDLGSFLNQTINPNEQKLIQAERIDNQSLLNYINENDSIGRLDLETVFILNTSDPVDYAGSINLKINDTTQMSFTMADYYAYDDGVPEFEYGIRGSGTQVAYQYISSKADILSHIDVNFRNQIGAGIDLIVWNKINASDNSASEIYRKNGEFIKASDSTGTIRYNIGDSIRAIAVQDTFYIGFELISDNEVFLGFDKNYNSNEKIYLNNAGEWSLDDSNKGSLILRPVFSEPLILGLEKKHQRKVQVFPNPSKDIIVIKGNLKSVNIFDLSGRLLYFEEELQNKNEILLNVSHLKSGIYTILIDLGQSYQIEKIIINH